MKLNILKHFTLLIIIIAQYVSASAQVNDLAPNLVESSMLVFDDLNGDGNTNSIDSLLCYIYGLYAIGIDNIEMSNNPKMLTILSDFFTENKMTFNGYSGFLANLKPVISIIDDDTVDNQIPDSHGATKPTSNKGGYFSVLLPLTLSLSAKHHCEIPIGLACEGHRVGLTTFKKPNDNYSALNTNGKAVKWLHNNMGWNVFNHSMTAQLPQRSYYVDGITSELADTILANSYYVSSLSFSNTCVIDRLTGKWYEPNSSKTVWIERTPTKKYAQIFYQDFETGVWYFNRDFDFEYSWGKWFKRAEELGLPNEKLIVHNGGTTSVYTISASRKYAYASVRTTGTYNNPPLAASINRIDGDPSNYGAQGYNTWNDKWVNAMESVLQKDNDDRSWVVLMTHTNDQEYFRNYYLDGRTYPASEAGQPELRGKDNNYPSDWIVPLEYEEILDIIGVNEHNYINNPPSRLNISSWAEWHPAPGTHLAALYYILDKALDMGIPIIAPYERWKSHGNILNIGVDKRNQTYSYKSSEQSTPYTDEEKSYLTIGADMSVRYSFNPSIYTDISTPDVTVTVANDTLTYDGSAKKPDVIVKDGAIPLVDGIHYTISYSNNINVGTPTVAIKGKGHYIGIKTTTFTIVEGPYNIQAIDAEGNTIGRNLDYDDEENNTMTLFDSYKSLTVAKDIPLRQISYTRTFIDTNWQALYVPFEIPVTAEFLEHFEVAYMNNVHQYDDDDDGTIDRTIVEFFKMKSGTLKANYPYIIKAKVTGTQTITVNEATLYATAENCVDCRSTRYEYVFKGTYSHIEESELTDCYAMSGDGWETLSAGSFLNPFRVYLRITPREGGLAPLKSIGMRVIETTEIERPSPDLSRNRKEGFVFNLVGQKIEHPTQGVYIINGKKAIIR